ncbi:ATP-binding protein [Devosia nitrariae]|uniref:ORC1/DEAH AAA+ ATPase domain-containing protein n=1 Tax=Devosia nitrariae TaxID=2071872 RepID=A0ABQ5W8Y8_9HYPH|nr:ATP-binding protein [Devosia nitrariae]GLQ56552.1 hypothetical protein GCM10010862_38110 [Devosia nitrariae]
MSKRLSEADTASLAEAMLQSPLDTADLNTIQDAINRLDHALLVRRDPDEPWSPKNRQTAKAVVVIAPARTGKTYCIDYAVRHLSPLPAPLNEQVAAPFAVTAPSFFTIEELGRSLLAPMNLLPARALGAGMTMSRLYTRVGLKRPRLVHIDEFQRVLTPERVAPSRRQEAQVKIFSHIRDLLDLATWPLPLVLSGTRALQEVLERPDMDFIRERCTFIELKPMSIDNADDRLDLADALDAYGEIAQMRIGIEKKTDFFGRLILASNYNRGLAFEVCREAILLAAQVDDMVGPEHFAAFYARKVGCLPTANPFLASNWKLVTPGALFAELLSERGVKK